VKKIKQFSISISIVLRSVGIRGMRISIASRDTRQEQNCKSSAPVFPEISESECGFKTLSFPGNIVDSLVTNQASQLNQARSAQAITTSKSAFIPARFSTLHFYAIHKDLCRISSNSKTKIKIDRRNEKDTIEGKKIKKRKKGENRFVQLKTELLYAKSKQKDIDKKTNIK